MNAFDLSGVDWRISSHSGGNESTCVEVAEVSDRRLIAARDSTDRDGPVLAFGRGEWAALLSSIKGGELDL